MGTLAKPELRGHLSKYIGKSLLGALLFCTINCSCFYYFYMEPRKRAYAEFHRTYNAEEHLKYMEKYGYLQATDKTQP